MLFGKLLIPQDPGQNTICLPIGIGNIYLQKLFVTHKNFDCTQICELAYQTADMWTNNTT